MVATSENQNQFSVSSLIWFDFRDDDLLQLEPVAAITVDRQTIQSVQLCLRRMGLASRDEPRPVPELISIHGL